MFDQKPFQPDHSAPITKWSYLRDLRDHLQAQADDVARYLSGLDATACGIRCSGCGLMLETEGDFARHFVLSDTRYLNLGNCPVRDRTNPRTGDTVIGCTCASATVDNPCALHEQPEDTLVSQPDEEDVAAAQYGSLDEFLAADPWRADR